MSLYLSTSCFPRMRIADAARKCAEAGCLRVEISAPHGFQSVAGIAADLECLRGDGYAFNLHNYAPPPPEDFVLDLASAASDTQALTQAHLDRVLALCAEIPMPVFGIHAGYLFAAQPGSDGRFRFDDSGANAAAALRRATEAVCAVAPRFSGTGTRLAIENLFPGPDRQTSLACTFDEIAAFMAEVPETVGVLLDLGHLNVSANLLGFDRDRFLDRYLKAFAARLFEIHLSENDGTADQHRPVLAGSWQLAALRRIWGAIRPSGHHPIVCLEARSATPPELVRSVDTVSSILEVTAPSRQ